MVVGGGGGGVRKANSSILNRERGEGSETWGDIKGGIKEGREELGEDDPFNRLECIADVVDDSLQMHPFRLKRFLEAYEGTVGGGMGSLG